MRIFVYGSLRRKQGNSHWMTNAQWLGAHSVNDYQLYSLGHYPGAVPGEGTVHGEVYRIDASTLAELDALRTKGGEYAPPSYPDAVWRRMDVCLSAPRLRDLRG
nr:AIG2 family protein [Raoultella sp. NCTC 9187]